MADKADKNLNNKSQHTLISNNNETRNSVCFRNESEPVANQLINKLISLTISTSIKNNIEKEIPSYCYDDLKSTLDRITDLSLLVHDKDDIKIKFIYKNKHCNSSKQLKIFYNINNDKNNIKEVENNLNKSVKNINYQFEDSLNPDIPLTTSIDTKIFSQKDPPSKLKIHEPVQEQKEKSKDKSKEISILEKSFHQILKRKQNKNNNSKINITKTENSIHTTSNVPFNIKDIEKIQKVESHKFEEDIPHLFSKHNSKKNCYIKIEENPVKNNWDIIEQPTPAPMDRNASTLIKYESKAPTTKKKIPVNITVIDETKQDITNTSIDLISKKLSYPLMKKNKNKNKFLNTFHMQKIDENPKKKKRVQMIELSSYDLDPKIFEIFPEGENIQELRSNFEKELELKRLEKLKLQQIQKALELKRQKQLEIEKELAGKDITIDFNGEIVFVKPLNSEQLQNDFRRSFAKSKEKGTIQSSLVSLLNTKKKKPTVEKNPTDGSNYEKQEREKLPKKRNSIYKKDFLYKQRNLMKDNNINKNTNENEKKDKEKNNMRFAAGSNFDIINLECGVSLKEDQRVKTGGRDYLSKYGRCSIQTFRSQLSKTTSFFYRKAEIQNNSNDKNKENETKKTIIEDKDESKMEMEPNETNNTLSLKTKNLNKALQNLDLITEGELRDFNKKNIKKRNIIKHLKKESKTQKTDYNEVNKFTKTLLGDVAWGRINDFKEKPIQTFRLPKKPEDIELSREVSPNLIHMPRKRLPPISGAIRLFDDNLEDNKLNSTRLKENKKKSKIKKKKVEIESKSYLKTVSGFHKNAKSNL